MFSQAKETFVAGFSLLTEPPSVEGNLTSEPTPRVQVPFFTASGERRYFGPSGSRKCSFPATCVEIFRFETFTAVQR